MPLHLCPNDTRTCTQAHAWDSLSLNTIKVYYTQGTPTNDVCGPFVEVKLDIKRGNSSFNFCDGPNCNVIGDICTPIGLDNKTRITVDEAFALATKKAGKFTFLTLNFRYILYPCVTEPTFVFTTDASNPANPSTLFIGVDSRLVCTTVATKMYTLPNGTIFPLCQDPDRLPKCYP